MTAINSEEAPLSADSLMASAPRAISRRRLLGALRQPEPTSLAGLVRQMEADYQFRLGYLVLAALVESAPVRVEAPTDGRSRRLADHLQQLWRRRLPAMLRCIAFGRVAFEKDYRYDPATGLLLLHDVDALPFEQTALLLSPTGDYAGVELRLGARTQRLAPAATWWLALDPTPTEPHGKSRYLGAAHEVWRARQQLLRQEEIWYSHFAIGHAVARAPERHEVEPARRRGPLADDPNDPDPMDVMRQRCEEIESGGVLILSSKAGPNGKPLYDYLPTPGQKTGAPLEQRRRQLDAAALRALGIPERAVTQDAAAGSYALAAVHREILNTTGEGILSQIVASFQQHVVDKVVALNWPSAARPTFTVAYPRLGSQSVELAQDLVRSLAKGDAGNALVQTGLVDLQRLCQLAGVPLTNS